jgi:hypothetical protein
MTFYAKPVNRPLALEGWFEKSKNRLFGHVRINIEFYFCILKSRLTSRSDYTRTASIGVLEDQPKASVDEQ